jgi:hypothetical protein
MTTLPEKAPYRIRRVDYATAKATWGAKHMPRPPKDGEVFVRIDRAQLSPHMPGGYDRGYVDYVRGDMIGDLVIVVTGKPFRGRVPGYGIEHLQYAVCRPATAKDNADVAAARAAQDAEDRAVMAQMMRS